MTTHFPEMPHTEHPRAEKSADEYEMDARKHRIAKSESQDRCDTDGFVSQWASGLSYEEARERANILRNGGRARFVGLYQGDRRVKARVIETGFGPAWLLHESEHDLIAKRGKPFVPVGGKSRVLKSLGLCQRSEWDLAWAEVTGTGYGLSGQAWIGTVRCGDKWGADATPCTEE